MNRHTFTADMTQFRPVDPPVTLHEVECVSEHGGTLTGQVWLEPTQSAGAESFHCPVCGEEVFIVAPATSAPSLRVSDRERAQLRVDDEDAVRGEYELMLDPGVVSALLDDYDARAALTVDGFVYDERTVRLVLAERDALRARVDEVEGLLREALARGTFPGDTARIGGPELRQRITEALR